MTVTLPYPPSANRYWRNVAGRVLVSREARTYKTVAAIHARAQGMRPTAGPVVLTIDAYRPRRIGDLDNLMKVLGDALRGVAYEDDSQVVEIRARRFDDKANPRAVVTVQAAVAGETAEVERP